MNKNALTIFGTLVFLLSSFAYAEDMPKVGGFPQIEPSENREEYIGAGWGHRSMTFGVMNLMSGMTSQVTSILRTGKVTPENLISLADILDHLADMMNYAPAYMMGTKRIDSDMIRQMQEMLKELEKIRKSVGLR